MKNRIPSLILAGALLALGGAASAQCNIEVRDCPADSESATNPTDPIEISLAPRLTWTDPGTLDEPPERAGYGRLSFRLLHPKDGKRLDVELTPDTREFADRTFLGWLGSYFTDTEQTYLLSIEVLEFVDGEPKVVHRRPVYSYTRRESFSAIDNNQMIDFGGDIGYFFKNDEPRRVRLVLHRTATTDFVTRNVEKLFALGNESGETFENGADGKTVDLDDLNSLIFGSNAGRVGAAIELVDTLIDPFEQTQTIAASRTLRHAEKGNTHRIHADFYPRNARTADDRANHLRLEVALEYHASLLPDGPRETLYDIRDAKIHVDGNVVQPLDYFVRNNAATKAAWEDVGTDRHDTKRVCDSIADALNGRLVGADLPIAISAMLNSKQADFSEGWNEDTCFGPDKAVFDEEAFRKHRFVPLQSEVAMTDEKIRSDDMVVLPAGLSGVLKIPAVREAVHTPGSPYRAALRRLTDNGERRVTLCDETGLFDSVPCNGGANATPYTADALLHRLAREVDLLEVDGIKVGLGCFTYPAEQGGDTGVNDLGSVAVIGNRTVEFLWQFKNRDGAPVLDGLTISHPSPGRAAIYEANAGGGCGTTALEHRIWAFNGETEGA
ncbi:MAG: hypothetical protein RID23_05775 [Roseovarius sp.]